MILLFWSIMLQRLILFILNFSIKWWSYLFHLLGHLNVLQMVGSTLWWPTGRHDRLVSIDEQNLFLWSFDTSKKNAQVYSSIWLLRSVILRLDFVLIFIWEKCCSCLVRHAFLNSHFFYATARSLSSFGLGKGVGEAKPQCIILQSCYLLIVWKCCEPGTYE